MTRIYFIRHCEAMGNLKRLFQGSIDLDISDRGAKQLKYLKKRFADIDVNRVYSSPLTRTQKTAHAIADQKNLKVELLDKLIELDGGIVEGKPFIETFTSIPGLADTWDNHPQDFFPEGGESMKHAYQRIWEAVSYIVKENPNKTIAVATHGGVLRCLMCRLQYGSIDYLKDTNWCENTAVTLIEFDEMLNFNIKMFNDISHLPEGMISAHSRISSFMGEQRK